MDDHVAIRHELRNHEFSQGRSSETDQDGVKQNHAQEENEKDNEPLTSSRTGKEEPTCDDNHVRNDCDAQCHKIGIHELDQYHRGKTEPTAADQGEASKKLLHRKDNYPSTAPRVIWSFLKLDMGHKGPMTWSIDNYDGEESWQEHGVTPPKEYEKDEESNASQYHKMAHALYQLEGATDDLMKNQKQDKEEHIREPYDRHSDHVEQRWEEIKRGVKRVCVEMYHEIEDAEFKNEIERIWSHNQQTYVVNQWSTNRSEINECRHDLGMAGDITYFNRGQRRRRRRQVENSEDDYTDEEEEERLVCSMSGRQWEALPYPIVIDSGACASVLPSDWCNHVNLIKTLQSEAQEFFRATNSKKKYNEGKKLVSVMTKESAMRDMNFTICSVTKALGSVSQMCRAGNRIVFNPPWNQEGSYIEHEETGENCG